MGHTASRPSICRVVEILTLRKPIIHYNKEINGLNSLPHPCKCFQEKIFEFLFTESSYSFPQIYEKNTYLFMLVLFIKTNDNV